jgi:hypothetical protein
MSKLESLKMIRPENWNPDEYKQVITFFQSRKVYVLIFFLKNRFRFDQLGFFNQKYGCYVNQA